MKKSKDLQGFHWYILRYSEKWQSNTQYILITYYKRKQEIECQTNTDHSCPLKQGNTQSVLHLAHNIKNYK